MLTARALFVLAWLIVVLGAGTAEFFSGKSKWHKTAVTLGAAIIVALPTVFFDRMVVRAQIERQNAELQKDIVITIRKPSSGSVIGSVVTAANDSTATIRKHSLWCTFVQLDGADAPGFLTGIDTIRKDQTEPLLPGDSQSEVCMTPFALSKDATCADIIISFSYWLPDDPKHEMVKRTRFVTRVDRGILDWYGQPVGHPGSYCPAPPRRPWER